MARIRTWVAIAAGVLLTGGGAWAGAQSDLDTARQQSRSAFVVVTESNARGTDQALQVAHEAQALAPASAVVLLDRGLPENAPLVQSFRVLAAPVPLILVVAPNGVVAGGALLKDATPAVLVKLIPSPKKAEMLLALSKGMPVFVVTSSPAMDAQVRAAVFSTLKQAHEMLEGKVATVAVVATDPGERAFLTELGIDPNATSPTVVVFNAKGQKTGSFREPPSAEALVTAAKKQAACCPGGSC